MCNFIPLTTNCILNILIVKVNIHTCKNTNKLHFMLKCMCDIHSLRDSK